MDTNIHTSGCEVDQTSDRTKAKTSNAPKWPHKPCQSIKFQKFAWGSMPPHSLGVYVHANICAQAYVQVPVSLNIVILLPGHEQDEQES